MNKFLFILGMCCSQFVHATFQDTDIVQLEGATYALAELPLAGYLKANEISLRKYNKKVCTGNYRGYVANWKIKANNLYLVALKNGECGNRKPIPLVEIWGVSELNASWYSGQLSLYQLGKRYISRKPVYMAIVENGKIVSIRKGA